MNKLLRTNFSRLFRMKSLYVAIGIMIFYPTMSCISSYSDMVQYGYQYIFEESLWNFGVMLAFVMPVIVHLFLAPEYTDHAIRNKIIIGHGKKNVFWANMITMMGASLILYFVWMVTFCVVGLNLLDVGNPVYVDIIISLEELLACWLLTVLLVLFGMFVPSKTSMGVLSMIISICLIASGVFLKSKLAQDEYVPENKVTFIETLDEEGNVSNEQESDKMVLNPKYIPEGSSKEVIRYIERINVGAQLLDVTDNHEIEAIWFFLFDGAMIVVACVYGAKLYKKKDIF